MARGPQHLFWDSCVFSAWLRDERHAYDVDSIAQYLREAKAGEFVIHTSMMASAEVLPSQIKQSGFGTFEEFLEDFTGAVVAIAPDQNVMALSGRLRDLPYKKGDSKKRRLTSADAVMLASAVHLRDAWGVPLVKFHTFDGGGKKDLEGKNTIPMLGYETWCEDFDDVQKAVAGRVISLDRCKPLHPTPTFPGMIGDAKEKTE